MKNRRKDTNLWLHPRKFIKNNIQYRIASSRALVNYKNAQVFLMSEVAFNPFHNFSNIAKEILLLKYDIWFDYLCEIEQYFLVEKGKYITEENVNIINELSDMRVSYYKRIMRENEDVFEPKYIEIWNEVHELVYGYLKETINDLIDLKKSEGFIKLTENVINVMNHSLYELYEIDVLFFTKKEFIFNFDSICNDYVEIFGDSLIYEKIRIFRKIRKSDDVIIKEYDDAHISFKESKTRQILKKEGINYKIL